MNTRIAVVAVLLLTMGACGKGEAEGGFDASFNLSEHATVEDVGLPAYPGSKPYHEPGDSSQSANLGLSMPGFGFKVVAVKLAASDRPERVAAFYRQALSKYGEVLECRDDSGIHVNSESSDELECESGDSDEDAVVYKAGTGKNQRIVAIKPLGDGARIDLVHLNFRD